MPPFLEPRSKTSARTVPLMGFPSPPTLEPWRIHCPGVYLTPFVALSGFLILSALCSPPYRPTLFHAGNVLGVSPFRAFSSQGAVPPLGGHCPPGVHRIPASPLDTDHPRETGVSPLSAAAAFWACRPDSLLVSSDLCWRYGSSGTVGQANRPSSVVGQVPSGVPRGPWRRARPKPFAAQDPGVRRVGSRCRLDPGAEAPQPTAAAMTPCGRHRRCDAAAGAETPPATSTCLVGLDLDAAGARASPGPKSGTCSWPVPSNPRAKGRSAPGPVTAPKCAGLHRCWPSQQPCGLDSAPCRRARAETRSPRQALPPNPRATPFCASTLVTGCAEARPRPEPAVQLGRCRAEARFASETSRCTRSRATPKRRPCPGPAVQDISGPWPRRSATRVRDPRCRAGRLRAEARTRSGSCGAARPTSAPKHRGRIEACEAALATAAPERRWKPGLAVQLWPAPRRSAGGSLSMRAARSVAAPKRGSSPRSAVQLVPGPRRSEVQVPRPAGAGRPGAVAAPKRDSGPEPALQGGPPPRRSADPVRVLRCHSGRLRAEARGRTEACDAQALRATATPRRGRGPKPAHGSVHCRAGARM